MTEQSIYETLPRAMLDARNPNELLAFEKLFVKHKAPIPQNHDAILEAWQFATARLAYNGSALASYIEAQKQDAKTKRKRTSRVPAGSWLE